MDLASFANSVREHLWVLDIEPAFQAGKGIVRFMWRQKVAELQPLDPANVRLLLSSHGQLVRTIDLAMTEASVRLVADGIIAVFEPEEP
ncbi:MAG TPA: hypothetical protein VII30_01210 [Gemmatimonadaceae bacterium]